MGAHNANSSLVGWNTDPFDHLDHASALSTAAIAAQR